MRTLDLIRAFTPEEMNDLDRLLTAHKRLGLIKLFKHLRPHLTSDQEPDNATLFYKVFGEEYTKKKDYLLRNELRLLNEYLYKYLAERTALTHLSKNESLQNYWLARAYFERGVKTLFRTDIDEMLRAAAAHQESFETIGLSESPAMYSMRSLWLIDNQPKLQENIAQQITALRQWEQEEKKRFLYRLREIEAREAYLQNILQTIVPGEPRGQDRRTPGITLVDLSDISASDAFARYTVMKKHAFQTSGPVRIQVIRDTLALTESPEGVAVLTHRARFSTRNQLGTELIIQGHYEEGDRHLEKCITEGAPYKWPNFFSTVHNYMVNQTNLKKYDKGIRIYEEFKTLIEANRLKHQGRLFLAYFHLYLGNDDEALRLLPKEADLAVPLQIIARFVYTISFLMRQEYALAVTELKNQRRAVKAIKTGDYSRQLSIIDLYLRYASAGLKTREEQKEMIAGIRAEIDTDYAGWRQLAGVDVELLWLLDQLSLR